MSMALIYSPKCKGVFKVTLKGKAINTSELVVQVGETDEGELANYTTVGKYRLHTLPNLVFANVRTKLKSLGYKLTQVSTDKLPVCWRNL